MRFYLKFIAPKLKRIQQGTLDGVSISGLKGFDSVMGLQVENLLINNRVLLLQKLGLPNEQVINEGPYFQSKTQKKLGCQIDYLIQTRFNTLSVVEVNFSSSAVKTSVISEVV